MNNERKPQESILAQFSRKLLERSAQKGDIDRSSVGKLMQTARKVGMRMLLASALAVIAIEGNHARTRYHVEQHHTESGITFSHEDPETTMLLDFLTGKTAFPEELRPLVDRQTVIQDYISQGLPIPAHIDTMTHEEAIAALMALDEHIGLPADHERAALRLTHTTQQLPFDPDLYKAVWELQARYGNPRLRFAEEHSDVIAQTMNRVTNPGRSFYVAATNTIYINPANMRQALLAEDSHAKQYGEQPVLSNLRSARAAVEVIMDAITHMEDMRLSYDRQYERPGTIEYEAHKQLESVIQDELTDIYDTERRASGRQNRSEPSDE